jgi:hypothetical protein
MKVWSSGKLSVFGIISIEIGVKAMSLDGITTGVNEFREEVPGQSLGHSNMKG